MKATFIDDDGTTRTYEGDQAWAMLTAQGKPYSGVPELKQLPATKEDYGGKNDAGGRKAVFAQSAEYKRRNKMGNVKGYFYKYHWPSGVSKIATPWYGWEVRVA